MKNTYFVVFSVLFALIFSVHLNSNSNGAFSAGYTGAPIDNGLNCSSCHSEQPVTGTNLIQTNIPASGYEPGSTYTITLSASHPTFNRFGFMLTSQTNTTANPSFTGTWTLTNNQTQLRINNRYVSHTFQGTQGSNNSRTWQVDWTAPPAGSGEVAFYTAINAVNDNGTTSGDQTILGSLIVQEASLGQRDYRPPFQVKLFPNPATNEFVNIVSDIPFTDVEIFTLDGRRILEKYFNNQTEISVQLSGLKTGVYLLRVKGLNGKEVVQKLWIL
ncbi:choice-of-anchor V domain-containing protein [Schleiferia thermophila]|jgi:hypothetical protein|uniref:Putative secreted protein (Por secretion system target) n=1 Tax=Schleiferia thermophila TaxID=884107 RepID=A0A369ABI3_9FLAO|nr:choice-of-anchor V domain-containing protein [Schleiferia thermophila]KFD38834.1 hypothetical protein AT05_07840 [Schleiferia thermophila str. Yellowstone]PMB27917.1 T9SS C-terminal target domain-containing protein [Fischerella thermalis CCMEE 5319]RCX04784.1 putative secreted protein (Por secretion system target) [Schleiferia thermophila]GCD79687.1 hypothetical protein JCM30197_09340 [Schleiferia thermophila]